MSSLRGKARAFEGGRQYPHPTSVRRRSPLFALVYPVALAHRGNRRAWSASVPAASVHRTAGTGPTASRPCASSRQKVPIHRRTLAH